MKKLDFNVLPQPVCFSHEGMDYYLVKFEARKGLESSTHREPKEALDAAGHVPAVIRGTAVIDIIHRLFKKGSGAITLYDCRENMDDRVAYVNMLALTDDGLCFYQMDHGGGPGEHPALCWKKSS